MFTQLSFLDLHVLGVCCTLCNNKSRYWQRITMASRGLRSAGEVTLTGRVLPIGGVKEKALAARRSGITTLIFPAGNKRDWDELSGEATDPSHASHCGASAPAHGRKCLTLLQPRLQRILPALQRLCSLRIG